MPDLCPRPRTRQGWGEGTIPIKGRPLALRSQETKCHKDIVLRARKRFHFTAAKRKTGRDYVRGLVVEMFNTFPTRPA
jgi:hypothetical protein